MRLRVHTGKAVQAQARYWLAGYLEAEGSFVKGAPSERRYPRVQVTSTDRDILEERILPHFKVRYIQARHRGTEEHPWKPSYTVAVKGRKAIGLMLLLYPLMGDRRRQQIRRALTGSQPGEPFDFPEPCFDEQYTFDWLAGYLEGEGSFLKGPPSRPNRPRIQVMATDQDIVERVARYFNSRYTVYQREQDNARTAYIVLVRGQRAADLMVRLRPLMSVRRQQQIDAALGSYQPGLTGGVRGEDHPNARLTVGDVQAIRARLAAGEHPGDIARDYPVSASTINDIQARRTWAWVE